MPVTFDGGNGEDLTQLTPTIFTMLGGTKSTAPAARRRSKSIEVDELSPAAIGMRQAIRN